MSITERLNRHYERTYETDVLGLFLSVRAAMRRDDPRISTRILNHTTVHYLRYWGYGNRVRLEIIERKIEEGAYNR